MKRITKKAVREALSGMGGWTFSYSTSALSPWHKNPVLLIGSPDAHCEQRMERIFNALRAAGFMVALFEKRERGLYSRLVLGIAGQEEVKQ